jgi:hypothetical protein
LGWVDNQEAFVQVCGEQYPVTVFQVEHSTSGLAERDPTARVEGGVSGSVSTNNETVAVNGQGQSVPRGPTEFPEEGGIAHPTAAIEKNEAVCPFRCL